MYVLRVDMHYDDVYYVVPQETNAPKNVSPYLDKEALNPVALDILQSRYDADYYYNEEDTDDAYEIVKGRGQQVKEILRTKNAKLAWEFLMQNKDTESENILVYLAQ